MWIIDEDHLFNHYRGDGDVSKEGKRSHDFNYKTFVESKQVKFKLYDDDDVIYFSGRMTEERFNGHEGECFDPLDWAMDYAGCTYLEYEREDGTWEIL